MANLVSCQGCMAVVDLDNAPEKTTKHGVHSGIPAFTQADVTCPKCGGLLKRVLNGEEVFANEADPREKAPTSPASAKVAKPTFTKAKPIGKAKGKA